MSNDLAIYAAAVRVVPSRYMDSTRRISTRESSVGLSNPSSSSLNTSSASMRRVSHMPRHLLKTPGGPSSTTGTSDEVTTRGRDSLMVKSTRQHRTGRDLILASATQANAASVTSDTNPRLSLATPYLSRNNSGHATSSSSGMATTRAKGEREEAKAKKHKEKSGKKVDPEQKARREKDKEKLQKDKENVREKEKERLKEKLKEKAREKLREKARDAETEGKERENGKKEKKERKEKKDRAAEAERSLASWNQELALLGSALVQWSYSNARAQTLFARQQEAAEVYSNIALNTSFFFG
jgi:flagellar biosynthesis GTPase FlhF